MTRSSEPSLSIGALALQTGASVRSIRHYDAHGLLTSSRSANGYRVFPAACVAQVRQIQRLIATGFSLDDILGFPIACGWWKARRCARKPRRRIGHACS